jgi:hypothetical protein
MMRDADACVRVLVKPDVAAARAAGARVTNPSSRNILEKCGLQ